MQDDKNQDFFEFEDNFREFPDGQDLPRRYRPLRGRLFIVLGICAVIIAALATVFGIFRSDDSTLQKDLRQTFSIQLPPPTSQPAVKPPKSHPIEKIAVIDPAQDKVAAEPGFQPVPRTDKTASSARNDAVSKKTAAAQGEQPFPAPLVPAPKETLHKTVKPDVTAAEQRKKPTTSPQKTAAKLQAQPPTRIKPLEEKRDLPDLRTAIRQGRLQYAVRVYRRHFSGHPAKYSISLEVACQPQTVIRAFTDVDPAGKMFILTTKIGDRPCFAVLWGSYLTLQEARAGKASVPSFFTSQTSPRIVALSRYLGPD